MRRHLGHCLDVAAVEEEAKRRSDENVALVVEVIVDRQ